MNWNVFVSLLLLFFCFGCRPSSGGHGEKYHFQVIDRDSGHEWRIENPPSFDLRQSDEVLTNINGLLQQLGLPLVGYVPERAGGLEEGPYENMTINSIYIWTNYPGKLYITITSREKTPTTGSLSIVSVDEAPKKR